MQFTSSTILGAPSNLNGSSANNPAAATSPRAARRDATDRRPPATPGLPAVVIPPGSCLTDVQVTYTDLPNGRHLVERQAELLRVPDEQDVRVIKRFVQFVDDPDSLAIIVAVPTRVPGVMRPILGITHRKLRYLFNVAINWSLTRDRLRFQDGAVAMYTFTSCLNNPGDMVAMLPEELMTVDVRSDGLNFDPPTVRFAAPKTVGRRLVSGAFAVIAAFVFMTLLIFSVAAVLRATKTDAYVHAIHVTAQEVDAAFTTVCRVLFATARAVHRKFMRQNLLIAAFLEDM